MKRYVRQEALAEIGKKGQEHIKKSSVAVIGVGALGCVTAELLVRAGVHNILLFDKDKIDLVNLQRQMLFDENDIGKSKVVTAREKLSKINSEVNIEIVDEFLSEANSSKLKNYDLILDCTDNMKARHIINDFCEKSKKKWIYSAVVGTKGNVLVVDDYKKFRKVFGSNESFGSCEEIGVVNAVCSLASSVQVAEAQKILTRKTHSKGLLRFDVWKGSFERINF